MGLDMYLYLRSGTVTPGAEYLSGWEHLRRQEDPAVALYDAFIAEHDLHELVCPAIPSVHLDENGWDMPVIYWRKANAIHGWFVEHCQGGVDECQDTVVDVEQLAELAHRCDQVLADPSWAEELLPPTMGFFFGSYEVDDCYLWDLRFTANELHRVISTVLDRTARTGEQFQFVYHSSW